MNLINKNDPLNTKGPLAWMAQNKVAANLFMAIAIVAGLIFMRQIKQEVFPQVDLDMITISVPYPGASPEEVEEGILLAIEEQVRGIDGIKTINSTANENSGVVTLELKISADGDKVLNDVKSSVDRITSLPADSERPVISLLISKSQAISLIVYGDLEPVVLRNKAESIRDEILALPGINQVDLAGISSPEISVEVPREQLSRMNMNLDQIASVIRAGSVDLPGGGVKTSTGEILLRTKEKRYSAEGYADIAIKKLPDGTQIKLKNIASIKDTLADSEEEAYYNGSRAVRLEVYGDDNPVKIAGLVKEFLEEKQKALPKGVFIEVGRDNSELYAGRMNLLLKNGAIGLFLVLILLGLFLRPSHAFWVTIGMVISFCGALAIMPFIGVSVNMISLFAFILTLGIVVDDAIVIGEAIYHRLQRGESAVRAAIEGVREVAVPVTFSILTTVIAFSPMLAVPGIMGKFFKNIPMIVIPILIFSLIEGLFILPAHMNHEQKKPKKGEKISWFRKLLNWQIHFSDSFDHWVQTKFKKMADWVLNHHHVVLGGATGLFILTVSILASGRLQFNFMPKIEGDEVTAVIEFPYGNPVDDSRSAVERFKKTAIMTLKDFPKGEQSFKGIYAEVGKQPAGRGPHGGATKTGGHLAFVRVYLNALGEREFSSKQFAQAWRKKVGEIAGARRQAISFNIGPSAGADIGIELSHTNRKVLEESAQKVADELKNFAGVMDIDNGFQSGKPQMDLRLHPTASVLGLTERDLGRQVRAAFYGSEALRQQRGRDEIRVFVRLPTNQRQSINDIDNLRLRTPVGGEIPFREAAEIHEGRSTISIQREDGRRVLTVTADTDVNRTSSGQVIDELFDNFLPELQSNTPGLYYKIAGAEQERKESMGSLLAGLGFALLVMYALMAIAMKSYFQPIIILMAIPLCLIGAVAGHLLMGFNLSLISIMGLLALAGVAVNDSIVLLDAINQNRAKGFSVRDAIHEGMVRRFRPILLTSLTTFLGLSPMILETSVQARFLIPMAISLGFGILFATVISLFVMPSLYWVGHGIISFIKGKPK